MTTSGKVLIAVITCHKYRDRADAQRKTWVPFVNGAEVKFFVGRGDGVSRKDEVMLDVGDGYLHLPAKVKAAFQWAWDNGFDYVFRVDDDVYVDPERIMSTSKFFRHDYLGRLRGPSGDFKSPYASGFSYWLSRRAIREVLKAEVNDTAEDRWVGNVLYNAGIKCAPDYRYVVIRSHRNAVSGREGPRTGNSIISAGELTPMEMMQMHQERSKQSTERRVFDPSGQFDKIAVMVKTFLRDGYLFKTVKGIERFLPGAKIIVVDDGYESREKITFFSGLRRRGHMCLWLPFDSGFCAKSNEAVRNLSRPYMLIASDDFEFDQEAADGVRKLITVLDNVPVIGVASGRVGNIPYEGFIERGKDYIKEIPIGSDGYEEVQGARYKVCDLTVNYNLVRAETLGRVHWDERYKIGGDHYEFYDQVQRAGWAVAHVDGVNINQRGYDARLQHHDYNQYRGRAKQALPRFFEKYGISKYIGFDGREDVMLDGRVTSIMPGHDQTFVEPEAPLIKQKLGRDQIFVTSRPVYAEINGARKLKFPAGVAIPLTEAKEYGLCE